MSTLSGPLFISLLYVRANAHRHAFMAFLRIRVCDGHRDEQQSRADLVQSCALSLEGALMKCLIVLVTARADWTRHSPRSRR